MWNRKYAYKSILGEWPKKKNSKNLYIERTREWVTTLQFLLVMVVWKWYEKAVRI